MASAYILLSCKPNSQDGLRIALVVPYFSTDITTGEFWSSRELMNLGHKVEIFTTNRSPPRGGSIKQLTEPIVKVLRTAGDVGDNPIPIEIKRLRDEFDLIWIQEDYPLFCFTMRFLNKSVPSVLTTERYYYPPSPLKSLALRLLDCTSSRMLRESSTALTAHSNASRRFVLSLGVDPSRVTTIFQGVDTKLFTPGHSEYLHEVFDISKSKRILLNVGRLHPYKGQRRLIAAFKMISKRIPDLELVIWGRGAEAKTLVRFAQSLDVQDRVHIGAQSLLKGDQVASLYNSSTICIFPSIYEPFGMSALEAQSCGRPIIVSNTGGLCDIVEDRLTGLIVKSGGTNGLASSILQLFDMNIHKMGEDARLRAENLFDWNRIALQYSNLFRRCVTR